MSKELHVFIIIICDEAEKAQKIQACTLIQNAVAKIKGVKETYFTGRPDADITAFALWEEEDIPTRVQEIRQIEGVKDVQAKILVTL